MKKTPESYQKHQARLQKQREAKNKAVAKAMDVVDALWLTSIDPVQDVFTNNDRKAIANASGQLRSIQGGWINRR